MKVLILFLISIAIIGASSCKKSYACSCYNPSTSNYFTVNVEANNVTDATAQCQQQTAGGTASCNF